MQDIRIVEADLGRADHQQATLHLVDSYSRDAMGDGKPLAPEVRASLIDALRKHPTTIVFVAFQADLPVGIAVCFLSFSTFAARPLINIHDLHVLPSHWGRGIGKALIAAVEAKALVTGCCKLSLEVPEDNHRARRTYASAGFANGQLEPEGGQFLFLTKDL
jgi:GNAT superfamily N-acetyltransferase